MSFSTKHTLSESEIFDNEKLLKDLHNTTLDSGKDQELRSKRKLSDASQPYDWTTNSTLSPPLKNKMVDYLSAVHQSSNNFLKDKNSENKSVTQNDVI